MALSSVALIGLGEVGQTLAADLAQAGFKNVAAFDSLFSDPASIPSKADVSVQRASTAADAVAGRDLVISAVTAASDLDAARSVAPAIAPGAFFLDLNSVSPHQKQAASKIINQAGGRYVEAAVMSPIGPKRIASPMLLAGPYAQAFADAAAPLGFRPTVFSPDYGKASATKMCRSIIIKGLETLLTESMLTARIYGVETEVLASLPDLLPLPNWEKVAQYFISRTLEHGKRRAEEMREVAETVAEAGIEPVMARACAVREDWAAPYRAAMRPELRPMLDAILAAAKG